tara:strand:- start:768 stop:1127 length:360 start_codon:yes stop_codon:yes gene_type:complete
MTRLDAEYLEHSTYVDYSEPKISFITGKPIDDTKVIAEEWLLKPDFIPAMVTRSGSNDLAYNSRSVVVIGTALQCYRKFCEMLKTKGWQQKDCWDVELKPIYKKHYENNDRLPTIINLV